MSASEQPLPQHVIETVQAIEQLHTRHRLEGTSFDRMAERIAKFVSRRAFISLLTTVIVIWIVFNTLWRGNTFAVDAPPFPWLEDLLTLLAVYVTLLILAAQRRSDVLANHRDQLVLELALLNEQRSAKIVALIEEMRRDSPQLANRHDARAAAMASEIDAAQVSAAIKGIEQSSA